MGTWVKETDEAIYLMQGNQWISRIQKKPSSTNPKEQVLNVEGMRQWFLRADAPMAMTVSVGAGGDEPDRLGHTPPNPSPPEEETLDPESAEEDAPSAETRFTAGAKLRIKKATYFRRQPLPVDRLAEADKVLLTQGSILDIQYYVDLGSDQWQVELRDPTLGSQPQKTWWVYAPDVEMVTDITLTVTRPTVFKPEPKDSSQLPTDGLLSVAPGTRFHLINNKPAAGDHAEIELAVAPSAQETRRQWFVYKPDVKIEGRRELLRVKGDTVFKTQPVQSSELSSEDKVLVKKGTVFVLNSYAQPAQNHVRVALQGAFLGPKNLTTWFAYIPDIELEGTSIGNNPNDQGTTPAPATPAPRTSAPAPAVDRGIRLTLPGLSGTYYSNDPIYPVNQYGQRGNFTWGEALHVNRATGYYRKPANARVVQGILRVARAMEEIRRMYGDRPIRINSWYRDPATNAAVGGARFSRHLSGDAVDFVIPGVSCFNVYARLSPWWGNRGGLASSSLFTHIDVRGYRARWDYGY
ncbi:MAG: D-Ala-D-Ala carboxypeptidase family metallohydrolase [Leptolyngbya sp.]|nr:D-Ala-D-Ala carboxypeptidase family metallohydrolase [Leptolyngbya sp.]